MAVTDTANLKVFDIAILNIKGLKVVERGLIAESANLENRRVILTDHVLAKRPEKLLGRGLQAHQSTHCNFSLIEHRQESYSCLTLLDCCKVGLIERCFFPQETLKGGERALA